MASKKSVKKQEWIRPIDFQTRLQISAQAYRKARGQETLIEKKVQGLPLVEWNVSSKLFISKSQQPLRYTKKAIAERAEKKGAKKPVREVTETSTKSKTETKGSKKSDSKKTDKNEEELLSAGKSKLQAEAIKQSYLAKAAKLKFLNDSGKLIEVEKVAKLFEEIAGQVQKLILAVPNRVAGVYATTKDPLKIRKSLNKELKSCLTALRYNPGK